MTIVLPKAWIGTVFNRVKIAHHVWSRLLIVDLLLTLWHLDVFDPVLQQSLNTASNATEELIQKRQILDSVLVQQMSQT